MEKCPKANRIKDRDRNEGGTRNDGGEGGCQNGRKSPGFVATCEKRKEIHLDLLYKTSGIF